jgi:hypothetical protein
MKPGRGFTNRTFLNALLWQKISYAPPLTYIWATMPIEHHSKFPREQEVHAVRAEGKKVAQLTRTVDGETCVEYACSVNMLPQWVTNTVVTPALTHMPYAIQQYFLHVKPTLSWTAKDGVLLGHLLADTAEQAIPHERASAISAFVLRTTMLHECGFVFLDAMLAAFFTPHFGLARFKTIFARPVPTADPAALSSAEATTIASGFDAILRMSTDPTEAVDDVLSTYPALVVMAQRHTWFRKLLETIAKRRRANTPLGLKLRLAIGAGFSIADMASDMAQIINFFHAGQAAGACALIGLIGANLAAQLVLVVYQNQHRGRHVVLKECLIVLSLMKHGVDEFRASPLHVI